MTESQRFPLIAKTVSGLEGTLADELISIGATDILQLNRAVSFMADTTLMYKVNYLCRTALRFLKPLFHFEISTQQDLYDHLHEFPWEELIEPRMTIAIDAVISYTVFTNSQYVAQRAKDAIADRIRDKKGARPSVELDHPDVRVNVHLFKDQCTVALDTSGHSLHRRGYRIQTGPAPINEVLAAGLIRISGWNPGIPLYDPMCGSGTLLIEAAMAARNIPAGFYRKDWGFMRWLDFDPGLWNAVMTGCNESITMIPLRIHGSDRSRRAIESAEKNLEHTSLQNDIVLEVKAFELVKPPFSEGLILFNPPYDERIRIEDSVAFHKMIGDTLKRKYPGFTAWLISADLDSVKFIGLKPSAKIRLLNGPLECRFLKFDLYPGRKDQNP